MNETPGSESPVRMKALVGLPMAVHASFSAKDDLLEIAAPFGELIVPYCRILNVSKDVNGVIRLDVAGGVTISLDVVIASYRETVYFLLLQKIVKSGSHPPSCTGL